MFENSNPFASPFDSIGSKNTTSDSLAEAYQKLEFLKNQQMSPKQNNTVFTDIAREWDSASDDEKIYIENSKEYIEANNEYEKSFSMFLIEYFGNDFINSKYGRSAEKVLAVIKDRKENYKNKFAEDIQEIKAKNDTLIKNNESLAEINKSLQDQLLDIQNKLSMVDKVE